MVYFHHFSSLLCYAVLLNLGIDLLKSHRDPGSWILRWQTATMFPKVVVALRMSRRIQFQNLHKKVHTNVHEVRIIPGGSQSCWPPKVSNEGAQVQVTCQTPRYASSSASMVQNYTCQKLDFAFVAVVIALILVIVRLQLWSQQWTHQSCLISIHFLHPFQANHNICGSAARNSSFHLTPAVPALQCLDPPCPLDPHPSGSYECSWHEIDGTFCIFLLCLKVGLLDSF